MTIHGRLRWILIDLCLGVSLVGLSAAACAAQGAAVVSQQPAPAAVHDLARLEPATGTYFGASLDWRHDSTTAYADRLGRSPAAYVAFTHFPVEHADAADLDMYMDQVRAEHGIALLTVEPTVALDDITPTMVTDLAARLAGYNASGLPVLVRFAHEMNGSWYAWGQKPDAYVRAFRLLASAVHEHTTESAMVWAPNYGGGYPFAGGLYEAHPGSADFARLDTNHDGHLDDHDDMYAPYYPGDDAVDWVGMTLYHWGDSWPWGRNVVPEDGKFVAQLTGTYNGSGGDDRAVPDFYQLYAVEHAKPLAIPETAAFYDPAVGGDSELDVKRGWWRQVFNATLEDQLPALKLINWFEWRKPEPEVNNAVVDWTATLSPDIREAFLADLPQTGLVFAPPVTAMVDPATSSSPAGGDDADAGRSIRFAGETWGVRRTSELEGPGPNYFSDSPESVWLDSAGRLHLRLSQADDGHWYCAEITSSTSFGYGVYQFTLDSRVDALSPNVALGLFTWSEDPAENHRELDIEFARFGQTGAPVGRFTLQPYTTDGNVFLFVQPATTQSTHTFRWTPDGVTFRSWDESRRTTVGTPASISEHAFSASTPHAGDERVHLNLWLDAGRAPDDGQPVEVIVRNFSFTPLN